MPRGEDYSEKLKGALAANLPHLKVPVQPKDITVTQAPDGNSYRVKVVLSVPMAGHTGKFRSVTMEETYTDNEALEIKGDAYRQRTTGLAETLRERMAEAAAPPPLPEQ